MDDVCDLIGLIFDEPINEATAKRSIKNGSSLYVKYLYDNGHEINTLPLLKIAIKKGYFELFKILFEHSNLDPVNNQRRRRRSFDNDIDDFDLLKLAIKHNHINIIKYLFDRGYNVGIHGDGWESLDEDDDNFYIAIKNGHFDLVKLLVDRGANVHSHRERPLIIAIQYRRYKIISYLLDKGAILNWFSVINHDDLKTARMIADRFVIRSEHLMDLISQRKYNLVNFFIDYAVDLNDELLIRAFRDSQYQIVQKLLNKNIGSVDTLNELYTSALNMEDLVMIEILLNHGVEIRDFETLFHLASHQANSDMIRILLNYDESLDYINEVLYYAEDPTVIALLDAKVKETRNREN